MNKSVFHGNFKITGCFMQTTGYWTPAKPHTGLDLVGITSKQIYSPCKGIIEFSGNVGDGFGNYVRLIDALGHKYYLCHMESIGAKTGQKINYGDFLGIMGHTGNVTGAHTHFEIRIPHGAGYALGDPAAYLGLPNKQGEYNDSQVASIVPPTPATKPSRQIITIAVKGTWNVRKGASPTAKLATTVKNGTKLSVFADKVNGWYQLTNGTDYISGDCIK